MNTIISILFISHLLVFLYFIIYYIIDSTMNVLSVSRKQINQKSIITKYEKILTLLFKNNKLHRFIDNELLTNINIVSTLIQAFPKLINHTNQIQSKYIDCVLDRLNYLYSNELKSNKYRVEKLNNLLTFIIEHYIQYTGYNLFLKNVFLSNKDDNNCQVNCEEVYHLFNDVTNVMNVIQLSNNAFLINIMNDNDAKKIKEKINGCYLSEDLLFNKQYEPLEAIYIESKIERFIQIFDWKKKEKRIYYNDYHNNNKIPIEKYLIE